jgi:hypothetical protein
MTFVIGIGAFANSSDVPLLAFDAAPEYLAIARWTIALGCSTIRCAEDEMLADEFR